MKRKTTEPTETSKFEISPSMGDAISRAAALAFNRDIDLKTTVKNVSLWALKPFKNHPYRLYDDAKMAELAESIRENGVISPILIRPTEGPNYEIVSGHNRVEACRRAGIKTIPAIIREMDDDTATMLMVEANQQREVVLPSEKAFAYKMRLDAMKRQGKRPDPTCTQVGNKSGEKSADRLAQEVGESRNQIQRYIRLTYLIPELRDMVDSGKLAMNPAVELSYLPMMEQTYVLAAIQSEQCSPTLAQAKEIKKAYAHGPFTFDTPLDIMLAAKGKRKEVLSLPMDRFAQFFPADSTPREIQDELFRILTEHQRRQERWRAMDMER